MSGQHPARADAPLEPEDRARAVNAEVDHYLRKHTPDKASQPEFLICRGHRTVWLVRWPNGSVKWHPIRRIIEGFWESAFVGVSWKRGLLVT